MDGFTKLPKLQCFKEGGSVGYKSRKSDKESDSSDIKQDKAVVKKAFAMHDKQEHKGEHTDLSKLKKGGRAKKCGGGTVSRYKAGGSVTNVYEAKKTSGDKDNIRKTKDITPSKAAAPSKATQRPSLKGSDVEKEKSKLSGDAMDLIASRESGLSAMAPSGAGGPDAYKKGGRACYSTGGSLKETDAEENPGLAKLPTNVRNKMGFKRSGGKVC